MTIQVLTENASKAVLLEALNSTPDKVRFYDPSIMNERRFTGADIKPGDSFAVVMDHPRRRRFAMVKRTIIAGVFKVT